MNVGDAGIVMAAWSLLVLVGWYDRYQ